MPYADSNASFQALSLLGEFFGNEAEMLQELWNALRHVLLESNSQLRVRDAGWEQDWLLAKYAAEEPAIGTRAWYHPPADFHSFPTFDLEIHMSHLADQDGVNIRQTKTNLNPGELFKRTATVFSGPVVLDEFYALQARIRSQGDAAMAQFNQTLAWLNGGIGKLFGGILLTRDVDPQTAVAGLEQRWSKVWALRDPFEEHMSLPELLQWKLDLFYGAEMKPDGALVHEPARQGQPRRWQQYWLWMSVDVEPQRAVEAIRMGAGLMIAPAVLLFLKAKLLGPPDGAVTAERLLALSILRRLSLLLQVMSWLQVALQHSFRHVRIQDLTSFAFSALRPHWPRRLFALSHRSSDLKAVLMNSKAWGNFRYSIDAQFAPHWETNVATVWGLFSAVPGLIRLPSAHYDESVWCRRERELLDYLCEENDFLRGRRVIELSEANLPLLEAPIPPSAPDTFVKAGQFPTLTTVFIVYPFDAWENRLLACAAITRTIFLSLRNAAHTAFVCQQLAAGRLPAVPSPTNHPDGWEPIARLMQAFCEEWSDDSATFPLAIDAEQYSPEEIARDVAMAESLIDLSDGVIDQPAAFAALEWNRSIAPAQIGNNRYGNFFAIDFRRITPEDWRSDGFMVIRGINRVHACVPVWVLQRSDQRVDEWPGIGTSPIFTQYLGDQWKWMWEMLDELAWPETYRKESKFLFAPKLAAACAATKARDTSYYTGKFN